MWTIKFPQRNANISVSGISTKYAGSWAKFRAIKALSLELKQGSESGPGSLNGPFASLFPVGKQLTCKSSN